MQESCKVCFSSDGTARAVRLLTHRVALRHSANNDFAVLVYRNDSNGERETQRTILNLKLTIQSNSTPCRNDHLGRIASCSAEVRLKEKGPIGSLALAALSLELSMSPPSTPPESDSSSLIGRFFGVFRYSKEALSLVWTTDKRLTFILFALTIFAGVIPGAIAYIGKLIVDAVVLASQTELAADRSMVLKWIGLEAVLIVLMAAAQRALMVSQSLLRALLGQRVNVMILEKAQTLELSHFEDSEFYDKMTRARREASSRPLSLVKRTFGLVQNGITLLTYGWLLIQFSWLAVLGLLVAALPAFFVETYFSGAAFRLFRWQVPETRKRNYLEWLLAREDYVKELKLFGTGDLFLGRYREIFEKLYAEDKALTLRRGLWGFLLGVLSSVAFYGAYAWIGWSAAIGTITLGGMTMYLLIFKQGQSSIAASLTAIGKMYEDNLYLSNLYEFLDEEINTQDGTAKSGITIGDGVRFEEVSFTYPGQTIPALDKVSLHLRPG